MEEGNNLLRRRRYSNSEKLSILRAVNRHIGEGQLSIRAACQQMKIAPKQYRTWSKNHEQLNSWNNNKAKSCDTGPNSSLYAIENELLKFIFELREQGIPVQISTVVVKASALMPSSWSKSRTQLARYQVVARWIKRHSLVHRMGTHESQKAPSETAGLAVDYMASVRPKVVQPNRSQDFILNMDQTPVPFSFHSKRTLEQLGSRTVNIRKSTSDTKRVTCAMTVTASGLVLTPMLIFKGAAGGRIEKREVPTYVKDILYGIQPNAWMDERMMLIWVQQVLKPYVKDVPIGIVPLLFLDSYRCHMMGSVVTAIQELGVEVEHIPGGCTSLCQPVDVGVNKPFKSRMRNLWEVWMVKQVMEGDGSVAPPPRSLVAEWCWKSYKDLKHRMVMNAWRHRGDYSFFPALPEPEEDSTSGEDSTSEDEDSTSTDSSTSSDSNTSSDSSTSSDTPSSGGSSSSIGGSGAMIDFAEEEEDKNEEAKEDDSSNSKQGSHYFESLPDTLDLVTDLRDAEENYKFSEPLL